jgi:site-specific recombinase XerC
MDSALLCHRLGMDRAALSPLLRSFERHLRAANRSERTIASYLESLRQAEAFLAARGKGLADARRTDLEAFPGELLTRRAPGTVATRYKVLRILYGWLEEEDEIATNPMARVKPPIVPEQPVPVVPEDGLRRLLATCDGKSFEDRRDTALILLLAGRRSGRAGVPGDRAGLTAGSTSSGWIDRHKRGMRDGRCPSGLRGRAKQRLRDGFQW